MVSLRDNGDAVERKTWDELQSHFPHYEEFWLTHAVPLRADNSIQFRPDIDEDFEILAMQSYSTYVNLARAYERIFTPEEDSLFFPDEIYALLQRAAELAIKAVQRFGMIYSQCLGHKPKIDITAIDTFQNRITNYRNLIHDEFIGVLRTDAGRLMVPRDEFLNLYPRWTKVLYERRDEHFVDVLTQIANHFYSLSSALETCWKQMCELSSALVDNPKYLLKRNQGYSVPSSTLTIMSNRSSSVGSVLAFGVSGQKFVK